MAENTGNGNDRLVVIWSSADREVALSMVYMYTRNAKLRGWWDRVRLVAWGPSTKLIASDGELQDNLESLKQAGVELLACKACTDMYSVSDQLTGLGFDVIYMGVPFTEMLKDGWTCLNF